MTTKEIIDGDAEIVGHSKQKSKVRFGKTVFHFADGSLRNVKSVSDFALCQFLLLPKGTEHSQHGINSPLFHYTTRETRMISVLF